MEDLIQTLVTDYKADRITWHDIQDIVEGHLMKQAGGMKEYDKIPIHQRVEEENSILEKIESKLKEVKNNV